MEPTGERLVPEFNRGQQIHLEHLSRYLFASKYTRGKEVLDIACGSGYGADFLLENGAKNVIGVDIAEDAIKYSKKTYPDKRLQFIVGDVASIPLPDASIDVVVSFETIEHVDEATQQKFFKEIKRVLRPKGILVMSTPNAGVYPAGNEFHIKELTREEFETELRKHFSNIALYYQSDEFGKDLYVMAVCTNHPTIDNKEYGATFLVSPAFKEEISSHVRLAEQLTLDVQNRDESIKAREADLAIYRTEIADKNREIRSQEKEIALAQEEIQVKDKEIQALEQELSSKVGELQNISQALGTTTEALHAKGAELSTAHQELSVISGELQAKNDEIAFMKTSRFWKFKTFYEKFKHPLFRLVKAMRKALAVLRRDGPVLFAKKVYWKRYELRNAIRSQFQKSQVGGVAVIGGGLPHPQVQDSFADRFYNAYDKSSLLVPYEDHGTTLSPDDIKLIAFYLPQFHPIPENDKNWGKGFTEWANVSRAQPAFPGHYQPRLPGDLGFYDLRLKEIMAEQISIAKNYGIHGFCFHHYWFSGKPVLRTPLNNLLENPDLDIPFCLHWANEPWTRTWDGDKESKGMLVPQEHSTEDDMAFIRDITPALKDKRYIKIDGRPFLVIYRPSLFPNIKKTIARWNEYCATEGIGKLYLALMHTGFDGPVDPNTYGFDAAIEYPPHTMGAQDITHNVPLYSKDFAGTVVSYDNIIENSLAKPAPNYPWFRGIIPDWDNTARRKNPYLFIGSTPEKYGNWLRNLVSYTKKNLSSDKRFIFVNAWNEWAEGAYLEPDRKYGYAYLEATYKALTSSGSQDGPKKIFCVGHDANKNGAQMILLNIVRELRERFHFDVHMLLLDGGPLLQEFKQYATVSISSDPEEQKKLITSLRAQGVMSAITNTVVAGTMVQILREADFHIVSLVHELPGIIKENKFEEAALSLAQHANMLVFPATYVKNKYSTLAPLAEKKSVVSPQGLYLRNSYEGRREEARKDLREHLGLSLDTPIVLGVGYGDTRKGVDLFVQAAQKLSSQKVHFVWVGDIALDMQDVVVQAKKKLPTITFVPFAKDTSMYYAGADLYAMTSREDPFPSVVLESMSVGVPVVGFKDAGGFTDIVTKDTGVLVPHLDADAMAREIGKLLADPKRKAKLGAASQKRIQKDFAFKDYVYDLLSLSGFQFGKVSALVTSYNYAQYLNQRLDSIVSQTYPMYEILILDDASTDDSLDVIARFQKESRFKDIKLFPNEKNAGSLFIQTAKGIALASGEYVWVAESDDACEENFLERIMPAFSRDTVVMSYSQSKVIDEHGVVTGSDYLHYTDDIDKEKWRHANITSGNDELEKVLAIKNTILNMSGVVFRKSAITEDILDTLKTYKIAGDWYLYVALLEHGDIAFYPESLNLHRRHSSSNSSSKNKKTNELHFGEIEAIQKLVASKHKLSAEVVRRADIFRKEAKKHLGV